MATPGEHARCSHTRFTARGETPTGTDADRVSHDGTEYETETAISDADARGTAAGIYGKSGRSRRRAAILDPSRSGDDTPNRKLARTAVNTGRPYTYHIHPPTHTCHSTPRTHHRVGAAICWCSPNLFSPARTTAVGEVDPIEGSVRRYE